MAWIFYEHVSALVFYVRAYRSLFQLLCLSLRFASRGLIYGTGVKLDTLTT